MDIRKEAQQKLAALKAANPDLTAAELLKRSMEAQVVEVQKQTGITLPSYYNPAAMNPMKFAEQERKKKLLWGNKNKTPLIPSLGHQAAPIEPPQRMNPVIAGSNLGPKFPFPLTSRPPPMAAPHAGIGNISSSSSSGSSSSSSSGSNSNNSGGQAALWANTRFSNDRDGKMAEKFRRLMGVKNHGEAGGVPNKETPTTAAGEGSKDKGIDILQKQETMFSSMERQYEMARIATHTHKGFGLGFTSQSFIPK